MATALDNVRTFFCNVPQNRISPTAQNCMAKSRNEVRLSALTSGQEKRCRMWGKRDIQHGSVVCVATPSKPTVSTDDRLLAAEEVADSKFYTVTEVEAGSSREFNPSVVKFVADVAAGVRCVTVEAEISREFVELDKSYYKPGQTVQVRIGESAPISVIPCSAPFPAESQHGVLLKLRGDIPAGSTKLAQYGLSVKAPLDFHVTAASSDALYNIQPGTEFAIGPFEGGIDLRPLMFLTRFPTVLIFASESGMAVARSLIEAVDVGTLYLNMREDVRLYCSATTPSELAYQNMFQNWETRGVKVRPTVRRIDDSKWDGHIGTFSDLFDIDDLEYDPVTTGALVLGSVESNDEAMAVLMEAGIPETATIRWDQSSPY